MQWFRFYDEAIDDDKIAWVAQERSRQQLGNVPGNVPGNSAPNISEALGVFVVMLSLANRSQERGALLIANGIPHNAATIAKRLGTTVDDAQSWIDLFTQVGILSVVESCLIVTNWGARQFVSDNVTLRTKKTKRNVPRNTQGTFPGTPKERSGEQAEGVPGNAPDTEADTEADTEGEGKGAPPSDDGLSDHLNDSLVMTYRDLWLHGGRLTGASQQTTVRALVELQELPEYSTEEAVTILKHLHGTPRLAGKPFSYIAPVIQEHLERGTLPQTRAERAQTNEERF